MVLLTLLLLTLLLLTLLLLTLLAEAAASLLLLLSTASVCVSVRVLSAQSWEEVVVEERLSERRGCPKLREKSRVVDSPVHEENSQGRNPGLKTGDCFCGESLHL